MEYNPRGNTLGSFLRESPNLGSVLRRKGEIAQALYRGSVRKRSGELARDVRVSTHVGGAKKDRLVTDVIVFTPYAASHEFGTTRQRGYHELQQALEAVKDS